jgi:hypothetical protein
MRQAGLCRNKPGFGLSGAAAEGGPTGYQGRCESMGSALLQHEPHPIAGMQNPAGPVRLVNQERNG